MKTKKCTKCGKRKSETKEFFYFRNDKNAFRADCIECIKIRDKDYYKNNIKTIRQYYQDNKKETLELKKIFYQENQKRLLKISNDYREAHKSERAMYKRNREKRDLAFKITGNLRTKINSALHGENKSLSTFFLIGCDIDYLMYHIQEQFTKGMSWDNHGRGWYGLKEWNIDHIKPCAKFDMSKKSEQLKCFNYTNLQPLWAEDNKHKLATWNETDKLDKQT